MNQYIKLISVVVLSMLFLQACQQNDEQKTNQTYETVERLPWCEDPVWQTNCWQEYWGNTIFDHTLWIKFTGSNRAVKSVDLLVNEQTWRTIKVFHSTTNMTANDMVKAYKRGVKYNSEYLQINNDGTRYIAFIYTIEPDNPLDEPIFCYGVVYQRYPEQDSDIKTVQKVFNYSGQEDGYYMYSFPTQ